MTNNDEFKRQNLPVMDLELDPTNPRIRLRSTADHRDCIEQMAVDGDHLVALAKDIADKGLGIDPIVVETVGEQWLVRDGNRRVSCLHMLHNPNLAPLRIRSRIQRIAQDASPPDILECHISSDRGAILEHMRRKHSGEGQGEGLRAWKTVEQARWEIDNGYPCQDESAAFIVRYAESKNLMSIPHDLPITTLTRFLNNERIREIGFTDLCTDPPTLNQNESVVLARMRKMIEDLDSKHISVSRNPTPGQLTMMEAEHQEMYMAELLSVGASHRGSSADGAGTSGNPGEGTAGSEAGSEGSKGTTGRTTSGGRAQQPSWKRLYVAHPVKQNGVPGLPSDAKKAKSVQHELRILNVTKCPNAAAVLVRMFLELSVNAYFNRKRVSCKAPDLQKRVKRAVDHMVDQGIITHTHEASGYKQLTSTEWVSVQTLHGFVHSEFIAEQHTVNTFWDNILPFLRHCWHS